MVRLAAYRLLPALFDLVDQKVRPKDRERVKAMIAMDFRRARKGAGRIPKPTPEIVREQTRERVRQFRARQRAARR